MRLATESSVVHICYTRLECLYFKMLNVPSEELGGLFIRDYNEPTPRFRNLIVNVILKTNLVCHPVTSSYTFSRMEISSV